MSKIYSYDFDLGKQESVLPATQCIKGDNNPMYLSTYYFVLCYNVTRVGNICASASRAFYR